MKYNAFISYNHNPRDIKIAKELQTRLEHYRIPKGIKTDYGIDRIERVFLDVGELGVAADLNDSIKNALDNTENLIVISSPGSKQSPWVHKEIEYFLSAHSVDKVFTVVSEGEPKDVLPDELLSREVEEEDGTISVIEREPLSGDYRGDIKKANKEELPRLVAAIIGCRYDELVQRQRQYRRKQMTVAFSVLMTAMVLMLSYFLWSNHKIRENYNNTLIEQSKSLAMQSEEALGNGDKISAVELALAALPKEGEDRPIVAEAVYALSEATDIYKGPSKERWVGVKRYDRYENRISKFELTSFGNMTVLAELFSNGRIGLHDADTGKEICAEYTKKLYDEGRGVVDFAFPYEDKMLLICRDLIVLFDLGEEKEIQRTELDFNTYSLLDCEKTAIGGGRLWIKASQIINDENYIKNVLLTIDIDSGKVRDVISVGEEAAYDVVVTEDGKYISYYQEDSDEEKGAIYILDTKSHKTHTISENANITDIEFDSDGRLIVCGTEDLSSDSIADLKIFQYGDTTVSKAEKMNIFVACIDPNDGQVLWRAENEKRINGDPQAYVEFEGSKDAKSAFKDKLFCIDNKLLMILNSNGEIEKEIDFDASILMLKYSPDEPDGFYAVLGNGCIGIYDIKEDSVTFLHNALNSPAREAKALGGSIYTLRYEERFSDYYITKYVYEGFDPEYKEYESSGESAAAGSIIGTYGELFVELTADYRALSRIVCRHSTRGDIVSDKKPEMKTGAAEGSATLNYVGINDLSGEALFAGTSYDGEQKVLALNVESGESKEMVFDTSDKDSKDKEGYLSDFAAATVIGNYSHKDGIVYSLLSENADVSEEEGNQKEQTRLILMQANYSTGEKKECEIEGITEDCKKRLRSIAALDQKLVIEPDSESIIFWDEGKIYGYGFNGEKLWEIELPSYEFKSLLCVDGRVITVGEQDLRVSINFYDLKSGTEKACVRLDEETGVSGETKAVELSDEELLVSVNACGYIIDKNTYELRSRVPNYIAYNQATKEFAISDGFGGLSGHIPYRTLEEIIAIGNELIS